jgi:hypothetical protein
MPVLGLLCTDPKNLKFAWISIRTLFAIFYISCGIFTWILMLLPLLEMGITAQNIGKSYFEYFQLHFKYFVFSVGLIFFTCAISVGVLFLLMAQKWKDFVINWIKYEDVFLKTPYTLKGWRLRTKIWLAAAIILICAAGK